MKNKKMPARKLRQSAGGVSRATGRMTKSGKSGERKSTLARSAGQSRLGRVKRPAVNKGSALCPECGAVFYDKHWHAQALVPSEVRIGLMPQEKCETCRTGAAFSGEVVIDGLTKASERAEVAALVRKIGNRASKRDPEDRIVHIHDDGSSLRVFTSENQLAVSIGKQVDQARKGGRLEIVWSADDKPVRIHWQAPEKGGL